MFHKIIHKQINRVFPGTTFLYKKVRLGADGRYASNPGRNFTMCADRLVGAAFTSVPTPGGFENPINGSGGEIDLGKNNRGVRAPVSLGRGLLWFSKKYVKCGQYF